MNTRSLSFRLVAWYVCVLTFLFLLLSAVMYFDLKRFLEHNLHDSQARRARQIAQVLLVQEQQMGEPKVVAQVQDWYEPEINDCFIRITRPDGTVLYTSGQPRDGSFNPAQVPVLAGSAAADFSRIVPLSGGKTVLIAGVGEKVPGAGRYLVEVGALLDPVEAMLNHLFLQLVLGLPIAMIVAGGGGYLLVRRALKPVEQIARKAEQITQHNLSERLPVARSGDELEQLSISLNHMITRLDDAFQNSKRFVADASHELRTPLTVMRGELEDLSQNGQFTKENRERLGSLLEEVERLGGVVEGLLALSRLDAGEAQVEHVPFDLAELAATTADQMSLLAEDKFVSVVCDARQGILVEGDRARMKQVIVNLLDNAIKYTPEGGAIRIVVGRQNGHAILDVADSGIGIPSESLPLVFERFFRVDKARSRDQGGAGLGLSIVKSICTAHGAEVQVESSPGKGSCFHVVLPLHTGTLSRKENENEKRIKT